MGALAVSWAGMLLFFAAANRNAHELWLQVSQLLWLLGNFWWMAGELHDARYGEMHPAGTPGAELGAAAPHAWAPRLQREAGYILSAGLLWAVVFFAVVRPLNWLAPSAEAIAKYDRGPELRPRWPLGKVFRSFREYEHVHILCWLGKVRATQSG